MRVEKVVLHIDDDDVDAQSVTRSLQKLDSTCHLYRSNDGEQGLAYLRDPKKERPDFILLDLNMPRMNGIEFLKIMKQDEELKEIPVIILTTSKQETEKSACYKLGVAGYFVKPVDFPGFANAIKTIYGYWTSCEIIGHKLIKSGI